MPQLTEEPEWSSVALDGTGTVWVLVGEKANTGSRVLVSQRAPDGTWKKPMELAHAPGMAMSNTQVLVDNSGNALTIWRECDKKFNCANKAAGFSVASGWESPRTLPSGWIFAGMAPNGQSLVLTAEIDSDAPVSLTPWSPQAGWGTVEMSRAFRHQIPQFSVAVNSAGQAVIASLNLWNVQAMYRSAPNQRWSDVFTISESAARPYNEIPPLALNDSGQAMVAWADRAQYKHHRINTKRLDVTLGVWQATDVVSGEGGRLAKHPALSMNASGQALVGWWRRHLGKPRPPNAFIETTQSDGLGAWQPIQTFATLSGLNKARLNLDDAVRAIGLARQSLDGQTGLVSEVTLPAGEQVTTVHMPLRSYVGIGGDRPEWLSSNHVGQALVAWAEMPTKKRFKLMLQLGAPQAGEGCGAP